MKQYKIPFIIALNKIDRIFEWNSEEFSSAYNSYTRQKDHTKLEYDSSIANIQTKMQEEGFNSEPFYKKDINIFKEINLVPTSAITGEGIPDLLGCITNVSQLFLGDKLKKKRKFKASILECNKIEGLGATIDIILVNGKLKIDDKICCLSFKGPITTKVKGLYIPEELKELKL